MRFFHLSDLHIGRQLHHYNLIDDQRKVLKEIAAYAADLHPDAIVIAGDIYDKSVPSAEAVTVFDEFLTALSAIEPSIPILVISGNHDSPGRLSYASGFLKAHHIYVAGNAPEHGREHISKVTLADEYGEVDFYLLPFLKPSYVKNVWEGYVPESCSDAVRMLIEREDIDYAGRRNVLISHQFYTGEGIRPGTCDSETIAVGGTDNVDTGPVKPFDYVALGHLHGAQEVGVSHIQYCGTPMKYSVSESGHDKSLAMVVLREKGEEAEVVRLPLHPLRDVRKKRGKLQDILSQPQEDGRDDYVSITLTDETEPYKPKEQLEKIYSHILEVRLDNERIRQKLTEFDKELVLKSPMDAFADFYAKMQGRELDDEEEEILEQVIDRAGEEESRR
ncbi:exonuclease SbcCD subunit D [Extibacter muris]|uniref:exonuclease SbcCD subunit D n=1 Tax=Extibacter muris TaxID=1796622 RepID=UPI001D079323|nr:exonuclease SbcCD subunit D [Extibacter muris]MCB6200914.1 exonuclease SbcCD subunit D [Extibacter muris]MCQ4662244.1 exonuclease SbcCD subunit D [Extibacter muris]MCQ4691842.1 exonuclease SbcCD subunit D [Extibacter muris]